jgi:hypothetical protein
MILDRVTDWLVTASELVGLLFTASAAEPIELHPREDGGQEDSTGGSVPRSPGIGTGAGLAQPYFAFGR